MDFWALVTVFVRRRYIALAALLVALVGTAALFAATPVTYTSTTAMVLTPPLNGGKYTNAKFGGGPRSNPYLDPNDGLRTTATVLVKVLTTAEVRERMESLAGSGTKAEIYNGSANNEVLATGPFLFIEATGATAGRAATAAQFLVAEAQAQLIGLQKGVKAPPSTFVRLNQATPVTTPQPNHASGLRAAAAVLAAGLIATVSLTCMADSYLLARARRRVPAEPPHALAVAR